MTIVQNFLEIMIESRNSIIQPNHVWSPKFWLPTLDSLLCTLDQDSWMADRDIADMFLNFQLHADVVPYTGVGLGPMYEEGKEVGDRR